MKLTLLMAITTNGFIAGLDDDTNWVKDIDALYATIMKFGVVVMGKRTYEECVKYDVFPYKNALNIVMTHDEDLLKKSSETAIFTDGRPNSIIELAESKGFEEMLLIGGGHVNGSFLKEQLIDKVVLDIHPLIKAKGIHLFESEFGDVNLELVNYQQLNDQILQATYKIIK